MDIIFPILTLLLLPAYLGLRYFIEYGDNALAGLGNSEKVAMVLLLVYVIFIAIVGKDILYNLRASNDLRNFGFYFIYPGIGFGIAIFPKAVAEFFSNYSQLAQTGRLRTVRIFGWIILIVLAINFFGFRTL